MENNKVKVKIFGQEYTVAGEKQREHILKVADYVDTKMREAAKSVKSGQPLAIAVLSAVNISDEYFSAVESAAEIKKINTQLEKDVEHYVRMWEEAKKNFLQYKEDAQTVVKNKDALSVALNEKEQEMAELKRQRDEAEKKAKKESETEIERLKEALKEAENNYFDIQMENVRIKSELERLKKIMA